MIFFQLNDDNVLQLVVLQLIVVFFSDGTTTITTISTTTTNFRGHGWLKNINIEDTMHLKIQSLEVKT